MTTVQHLGTIACECVIFGKKPVLAISHAGGYWQMYCSWNGHDFTAPHLKRTLKLIAIHHLVERDPTLIEALKMPINVGAERASVNHDWSYFEDRDD